MSSPPVLGRTPLRGLTLTLAILSLLAPSVSNAALKVSWDCYLPNARLDCAVLESSLESKIPFLRITSSRKGADVIVTLKSVPSEDGTRFILDFVGKPIDGYQTQVHTSDKIPDSIDVVAAEVRIMTKLERGLGTFMDQKIAAELKDGKLVLQLLDPVQLPYSGREEQEGVRWYLVPSIGTYFSDVQRVGINASGSASVLFNYSWATWRLQDWMGVNYNRQSQPVPGSAETASIDFLGANLNNVVSWSFTRDNRWSAALLLATEKNPQANYKIRANGSAGIEFDLVPRQTVNQKNFGFRCAVGPEFQRYDTANLEQLEEQMVGRQFCDVFLNWHFPAVDVGASLGETLVLNDPSFRSFTAGVSATWRLTDNFMISPWANLQQVNRAINEAQPTTLAYGNPRQEIEASMRAAAQQGYTAPLGVQSGLSIRFLFGNGSLNSEDQRWRGTSNLR